MTLPNFLYCGAPKAGSSSLHHYIAQHPDTFPCSIKEPFFFDYHYEKGLGWYESLFAGHRGEKVVFESTVWYMRSAVVPERVGRHLPNAKLLFVLRNPIDRAWSNYVHDLQSGHYTPQQPFSDVIRNEHLDPKIDRTVVSGGMYFRHLTEWLRYFPREQMLILLLDDLAADQMGCIRRVYEFLEIDPDFVPDREKSLMVTPGFRFMPLLKAFFLPDKLLGIPLGRRLWRRNRHFRQLFMDRGKKPGPAPEADRAYLREVYAQPNRQLGELLGRDLSHWR